MEGETLLRLSCKVRHLLIPEIETDPVRPGLKPSDERRLVPQRLETLLP